MSTVIAAIIDGSLHMCGDTAGSYSNGTLVHCNKVYDGGNYLLGVCGAREPYLSMCYDFHLPPDIGLSKTDYIAGPLRSAMKSVLGEVKEDSYTLVLAFYYHGEPCLIELDGGVYAMEDVTHLRWVCSGTGREVALGAMSILMTVLMTGYMDTRRLLEEALLVCCTHNAFTAAPLVYYSMTQP